jgi:hypothetical protein
VATPAVSTSVFSPSDSSHRSSRSFTLSGFVSFIRFISDFFILGSPSSTSSASSISAIPFESVSIRSNRCLGSKHSSSPSFSLPLDELQQLNPASASPSQRRTLSFDSDERTKYERRFRLPHEIRRYWSSRYTRRNCHPWSSTFVPFTFVINVCRSSLDREKYQLFQFDKSAKFQFEFGRYFEIDRGSGKWRRRRTRRKCGKYCITGEETEYITREFNIVSKIWRR